MTTRIFHVPGTRSIRVIWVCEELSHPYEIVPVDFGTEYRSSDEWRRLSPTGKVPVMTDEDVTISESGAMVQYLLDRYGRGRLQPVPGSREHALYLQWSWFAEATFARPLGEIVNHRRVFPPKQVSDAAIDEMRRRAHLCLAAVDRAVRDRPYLLGEAFSAADIMMGYPLFFVDRLAPVEGFPAARAYQERLRARPGCQRATADFAFS